MLRRTWVQGRSLSIGNRFCDPPWSFEGGRMGVQSARGPTSAATEGRPGRWRPSREHRSGKLPMKWLVSTSTPRTTPGMPSWTTHQSLPGVRRRRVSQPSIHLPREVNLPGMNTPRPGLRRFSFEAKNSSFAATARPPTRAAARSQSSVKACMSTPQGLSSKGGGEIAPIVNHRASKERGLDDALQALAPIRGERVAVTHDRGLHRQARLGVPDDEVRVVPGYEAALDRKSVV